MNNRNSVAALRDHLETLFPGKWNSNNNAHRTVLTGLPEIDNSITHGLTRKRITEWTGEASSGKTTVLRTIIENWCDAGFHTVYIDSANKLFASDWAYVGTKKGMSHTGGRTSFKSNIHETAPMHAVSHAADKTASMHAVSHAANETAPMHAVSHAANETAPMHAVSHAANKTASMHAVGHAANETETDRDGSMQLGLFNAQQKNRTFWVVRNLRENDILWTAEQLVRSNIFDIVIFDAVSAMKLNSRAYARLQRALDRTKCALIILRDEAPGHNDFRDGWGCHSRFAFNWSKAINYQEGITGIVSLQPNIEAIASRDGASQQIRVNYHSNVSNRLFTHPQVPDRRTSKTRART